MKTAAVLRRVCVICLCIAVLLSVIYTGYAAENTDNSFVIWYCNGNMAKEPQQGIISADVGIRNNSEESVCVEIFLAVYDMQSRLNYLVRQERTLAVGETCVAATQYVEVNENQKHIVFNKLCKHYNGELHGKVIAIWGLAFKPETDDMREATALITINQLIKAGCKVQVFDPVAMDECKRRVGEGVTYAKDMYDAVLNADALLLLTEWKQFRLPSWGVLKRTMNSPVIIDGRNIYDPVEMMEKGVTYYCIGR